MGFGSFFTRALDRITPWDRGGELVRRKKREEEEQQRQYRPTPAPGGLQVGNAQPTQRVVVDQPKAQRPENLFEGLNQNLKVGTTPNRQRLVLSDGRYADEIPDTPEQLVNKGLDQGRSWEDIARENNLDLNSVKEYSKATRPDYGITIERPKQSFGNRFRDIFDANTESDRFRRQEGNKVAIQEGRDNEVKPLTLNKPGNIVGRTPIIGHVVKGLNTLSKQIPQVYYTLKGDIKSQNAANDMFEENKGGLFNVGDLYGSEAAKEGDIKTGLKKIAAPTVVTMADLYTLGQGSIISEGIKQGGKAGLRTVAPNIVKAAAGNYISGDLSARSQDASNEEAIKSGFISSVLGLAPDVALPAIGKSFKNKVIPKLMRGRSVAPKVIEEELDDAAIAASAEAANQALKPRPIPVRSNIPIDEILSETKVPVRVTPKPPGELIREVTGDAATATPTNVVADRVADIRRAEADAINKASVPDRAIEGVTPRAPEAPFKLDTEVVASAQDKLIDDYAKFLSDVGEGNGTQLVPNGEGGYFRASNNVRFGDTAGKRMTKADWRDEAERQLRSGQADPSIQKVFDEADDPEIQALLSKGDQTPVEPGAPINVREVKSIPVTDQTVVPTNLPENPGTVRATTVTAPSNAKSATVAAQTPPAILPKEVQEILDNPKQFNKRQVAAARNQRKMARQVAKAQEDTAEALDRINTASPAAQSGEGFVPTGEFGKSVNGGAIQKVSRAAEMQQAIQETANLSPADVLQTARRNSTDTGGFTRRDIRNVAALFESKRIPRGTPEWEAARQILKEDGTIWGQQGALRNYTIRRTASANELINRFESKIYRLADDPSKIDSKIFDEVEVAEEAYTTARDNALAAYNRFTEEPTTANARAYHAAQDAAEKADKAAKITEYKGASKVLKGNKDIKQMRELEKMANDADLYQMDAVDASMLSGTGTFVRNFVNAAVGGTEEGLFGGVASRVSRLLTGQNVGGGVGKGSISGFKEGAANIVDASMARASNAGKNPLSHIKNWATTGNQLGDTVIDSQVRHNVLDHYTQLLKEQGFSGRELADRASVMARQDPDDLGRVYASAARTAAGLGSGVTRGNKFETIVKNMISDTISMGNPGRVSEATAKLITRMTVGFPTAIGRSTAEGVKRFTLGAPTFIKAIRTADPQARALLIKEGVKQAGSGALVIPPLFYAMGASDMITGAYPSDPEERARWEREGITENSIKIGGAYYQLPAYLGAWAVPGLFYASLGRNDGDFGAAAADTAKAVPAILPTDNITNWLDVINGRSDPGKFAAQTAASAVRASTPGGALLAEAAKMFDPTKNDTNTGTNIENFVDKVLTGIPGASNNVPNKESDTGAVISNPNPVALALGASSAVQGEGEQRTAQIQANVDSNVKALSDLGVLDDPNLQAVLDDKEKLILDKFKSGKKLGEGDLEKLQDALTKGVSQEGTDTAYLEREQYDTNLAVLKLKKRRMEEDKTVKPSDLKKVDTAIKRGEVYKNLKLPYDMISEYQSVGVDDWRNMGDPEDDAYDPEMYQKLWDIDQAMTKAGVSYRKGALDKNKYYAKEKGSGKGGRGSRQTDFSFGTLENTFAPSVREYASIDAASGQIPYIRTVRPNIVHKITSSR